MRYALIALGLATAALLIVPLPVQAMYRDGPNLYQYVQSSPIHHVDPTGLWTPGVHRKLMKDTIASNPESGRFAARYQDAFLNGNVNTDGASLAGTADWVARGFDASEAYKHYMVGSDEAGSPDRDAMRQIAKAKAETRISAFRDAAKAQFADGKVRMRRGDMAGGRTQCDYGWQFLGTAYHTMQDKYSHTNDDWMPLFSYEHGGTLSMSDPGWRSKLWWISPAATVYRMGKFLTKDRWFNSTRKAGAEAESTQFLKDDMPSADGPKGCNCIDP